MMAVYTDEEHGYDGDGDSSETSTGQELKQKNVTSGESTTPTVELIHLVWDNLHNSTIRSLL